jgi:hypothetical protein
MLDSAVFGTYNMSRQVQKEGIEQASQFLGRSGDSLISGHPCRKRIAPFLGGAAMRVLLSLLTAAILAPNAWAGVSARVLRADEKTTLPLADPNVPGVYRDIMVGTRLTVFVGSDIGEYWLGGLLVPWEDRNTGVLSARGYTEDGVFPNYAGSCLEAAGYLPLVSYIDSASGLGFDLAADVDATAGDWFVLDYRAEEVGTCNVELHEYIGSLGALTDVLLAVLSFKHVPSRDFDSDAIVNFTDFALLASQWGHVAILDPNINGSPDLNADSLVDALDMALFSEYWLERTDYNEPDTEPNGLTGEL